MKSIKRKTLLYKTAVEYGDYTINHVQGCAHGCMFPCYAFMMAKRFGRVKTYDQWLEPHIVENALELLEKELPKYKNKIKFVHFCFSTDPFMYRYGEISDLTLKLINRLNFENIKCTVLTKGLLPIELTKFKNINEYGITIVSLNEKFRKKYEPFTAPYFKRIANLKYLHEKGFYTWISIEPYPTPNIINQDINEILNSLSFVDKIIFGRLNYNSMVSDYNNYQLYYNELTEKVINFCINNNIEYHIKEKTYKEFKLSV
mgnify:CR=1 FL=1